MSRRMFAAGADVMGALYPALGRVRAEGMHLDARPEHLRGAFVDAAERMRAVEPRMMVKATVYEVARVLTLAIAAYINDPDQVKP